MIKYLRPLWLVLVCLSGGIALCFSFVAIKETWNFFRLNKATTTLAIQWEVKELSSSRYALQARYEFKVDEFPCKGKTLLKSPRFLNRFSAESQKKEYASKPWRVWYHKSSPSVSSLEKRFPQKKCLHALLTIGVFAYFYYARGVLSQFICEK